MGFPPLYPAICAAFSAIVIVSNILSSKMIALPYFSFPLPAGLLTYPLTFILTDIVTEVYGPQKAKQMVYLALGMSALSFGMIQLALVLPASPAGGDRAFQEVMGLSALRIFSSLAAYLMAQMVDIQIYARMKKWTRVLFLRNNGSTWISQMVDTVVIDLLFLYWGLGMEMAAVFPIMVFSYLYKALFSVAATPLFYLGVRIFRREATEPAR